MGAITRYSTRCVTRDAMLDLDFAAQLSDPGPARADVGVLRRLYNAPSLNRPLHMAEARGKEKVAKAELAAKEKDTPKNRYDVAAAKADADYNVAKEKCDDMKGKEKDQCQKDAKAARDNAKRQAKSERDAAEGKKPSKST